MGLAQIVYVSRSEPLLDSPALTELVNRSAIDNRSRDVTGVLLFCDPHFMQLLEGELTTISALFERIRTDPRHRDVQMLLCKNVARRLFPEWGMELVDVTDHRPLDRSRMLRLVDDLRTHYDTALCTAETRLLLNDFRGQLTRAA